MVTLGWVFGWWWGMERCREGFSNEMMCAPRQQLMPQIAAFLSALNESCSQLLAALEPCLVEGEVFVPGQEAVKRPLTELLKDQTQQPAAPPSRARFNVVLPSALPDHPAQAKPQVISVLDHPALRQVAASHAAACTAFAEHLKTATAERVKKVQHAAVTEQQRTADWDRSLAAVTALYA